MRGLLATLLRLELVLLILSLASGRVAAFTTISATACELATFYAGISSSASNLLRSALHEKLRTSHVNIYPYTTTSTSRPQNVWDALSTLDRDPNATGNVTLLYSQRSVLATSTQAAVGSTGWNREHVWPKSHGVGYTGADFTDLHHMRAADANVNSARGNKFFGDCGAAWKQSAGGDCETPAHAEAAADTGDTTRIFMPPAVVRGDIARALFYMAVRYEGHADDDNTLDLELADDPETYWWTGGTDLEKSVSGLWSVLRAWHVADPPSDGERRRNGEVCGMQGNRNPFVDYPDWVENIWNTSATNGSNASVILPAPPATTSTNAAATGSASGNNETNATVVPAWINELHYDNTGADSSEFVEVVVPAGVDPDSLEVTLYNGANGQVYDAAESISTGSGWSASTSLFTVNGTGDHSSKNYTLYSKTYSSMQNGYPDADGVCLSSSSSSQPAQFLAYGNVGKTNEAAGGSYVSFVADGGACDGMNATMLPVAQSSDTPTSSSLGLVGHGCMYKDFVWNSLSGSATVGQLNTGQTLGDFCLRLGSACHTKALSATTTAASATAVATRPPGDYDSPRFFTGFPTVMATSENAASLRVRLADEVGTVYWVVQTRATPPPTSQQVVAGQGNASFPPKDPAAPRPAATAPQTVANGSLAVSEVGPVYTQTIIGGGTFTSATDYDLYLVPRDMLGNYNESAVRLPFSTLADVMTRPPELSSPVTRASVGNALPVSFKLLEDALPGTVEVRITVAELKGQVSADVFGGVGGGSSAVVGNLAKGSSETRTTRVILRSENFTRRGAYKVVLSTTNLTTNATSSAAADLVAATVAPNPSIERVISSAPGIEALRGFLPAGPNITYNVSVTYQDAFGHPRGATTASRVSIDRFGPALTNSTPAQIQTVPSSVTSSTSASVVVQTETEPATVYFLAAPASDAAPSAAQIIRGLRHSGALASFGHPTEKCFGKTEVLGQPARHHPVIITGLPTGTTVTTFFVAVDKLGNPGPVATASVRVNSDRTAPSILSGSKATLEAPPTSQTTLLLTLSLSEDSEVYYAVTTPIHSSLAPTPAQVRAGLDRAGNAALAKGSAPAIRIGSASGGPPASFVARVEVGPLSPSTEYTVHFTAEDRALPTNLMATTLSMNQTTADTQPPAIRSVVIEARGGPDKDGSWIAAAGGGASMSVVVDEDITLHGRTTLYYLVVDEGLGGHSSDKSSSPPAMAAPSVQDVIQNGTLFAVSSQQLPSATKAPSVLGGLLIENDPRFATKGDGKALAASANVIPKTAATAKSSWVAYIVAKDGSGNIGSFMRVPLEDVDTHSVMMTDKVGAETISLNKH